MATRPRLRRPLSMTSLIDVIFLLLMFFMLATTFTRTTELPLATGGAGAVTTDARPMLVRLSEDGLSLNGRALGAEALPEALAGQTSPRLLVALAPGVSSQRLADLLATLRRVPGARVQVLG